MGRYREKKVYCKGMVETKCGKTALPLRMCVRPAVFVGVFVGLRGAMQRKGKHINVHNQCVYYHYT